VIEPSLLVECDYSCIVCICTQRSLSNAEQEVKHQQEMCGQLHTELTAVAEKCEQQSTEFEELSEKLRVRCPHWCENALCYMCSL